MSNSQGSDTLCIQDALLKAVVVDCMPNDSDSDFENLSYSSKHSKSNTPDNALHKLLDNFSAETPDHLKYNLIRLRKVTLISPSKVIDELDKGGSCVLHKMLQTFLDINYKDECGVDVIEITLNKSYLDYRVYQKGIVLELLQRYDKSIPPESIKFIQWQILSREGEELIVHWQMSQPEGDKNGDRKVKKFVNNVHKAIHDEVQLDDMIESILASGSLELLKYLKRLVEENHITLVCPIIHNAVSWGLFAKRDNVGHFQKCFEYLLEVADKQELCLVDENGLGMTALHFADQFNDDFMVKNLLKHGAPIATRDHDSKFPVQNVSPKTLGAFFDSLVTETPTRFLEDESVWRVINSIYKYEYELDGFIFMDFNCFVFLTRHNDSTFNDLELIDCLSESPRLNRLIDHPIPATLLEMHWRRFKKWIFLDQISVLFMILISIIFTVKYLVRSIIAEDTCQTIDHVCAGFTSVFVFGELLKNYKLFKLFALTCTNTVRRIFAKCASRQKNYREMHNFPMYQMTTSVFLKIPLLVLIIVYATLHCDHSIDKCKEVIGISLILFSINITLLIAYFNQTVAHYVIMFLYVAFTGFKFILSMFPILFGFGMGLFMLINNFKYEFKEDDDKEVLLATTPTTPNLGNDTDKPSVDWGGVGLSILRAFVMSTGELEVSSFHFHALTSYITFVFFIFVVPIVFFNLLNGLAIEDISVIKSEAMFWYRKTQLMVLKEFQHIYWKVDNNIRCVPYIDIDLYPDVIGKKAFIGINTFTREIFAMDGLTSADRRCIGRLSKCALANAEEILRNRNSE